MGCVGSKRWCKRVCESDRQNERGPWKPEPSPEKSEEDRSPERREREEGEDGLWRSALHIGDAQTNGLGQLPSTLAGTERTRSKLPAVVCCGMTSKQRFHAENGKTSRQGPPTPRLPVNRTCIAGEVVAQCGRWGGAQGSWPGSAWRTKLHFGAALNVLAGTWRGDSCPTDTRTHKDKHTTTSCAWPHLVFGRGGQDQVEIKGLLFVSPASSPSIDSVSAKAKEPRGLRAKQANDSMH